MNSLHHAGAFVLQFRAGTDFDSGRVTGRVEHVASGQTEHFESIEELLASLARMLKQAQVER
jgi:hypothetical protein